MPNPDLSILVVDDAKFSSTIIARTLAQAGYHDVRNASSSAEALKMQEARPASLLLADWMMPDIDGLELASRIRQLDENNNHFTYVILLTARESADAMSEAFERGVDDFISKAEMSHQLLPRVYAADRLADMQNNLLLANQLLIETNKDLAEHSNIDLVTGLGNQRACRHNVEDSLHHVESRGGAMAYLLLGLTNWHQLQKQYDVAVMDELATGICYRLRHLTRPLDRVCRIAENEFTIITHFPSVEYAGTACFRRVYDGINLKSFKTSAGYLSLSACVGVCTVDNSETMPSPTDLERSALRQMLKSRETGLLAVINWAEKVSRLL